MNILLTTVSLDTRRGGGTAERTRRLALALRELGHSVTVVSIDGGDMENGLREAGVSTYVTGFSRYRFSVPHLNLWRLWALVRAADIVHLLGYWNLLSVATAFLARRAGRAYALSPAGEFVGLERPRPIARIFHELVGRSMIRGATLMVAITKLERQQFIDLYDVPPRRAVVVPNGVTANPLSAVPNGLPERPFVLFLGRLAEVKGPDLLLEAFARVGPQYTDYDLVIAGPDFGLEKVLRDRVEDIHMGQRVHFIGFLNEQQRTGAYSRASLLCVPSRSEAMSLVALEGGICGVPVLLTDRCGFDDVGDVNGGMVVPASIEGLSQGLEILLSPATNLAALGANLQVYVARNFVWSVIAERFVTLFDTNAKTNRTT